MLAGCLALFGSLPGWAEQYKQFGDYQVHYIIVPTTFLQPQVAQKYNLLRGKNRALVNVSVLDGSLDPVPAQVTGLAKNLMGQPQQLEFAEVTEGPAIYYLALLRHSNEEYHQVELQIKLPDGKTGTINFRQKMYFEE